MDFDVSQDYTIDMEVNRSPNDYRKYQEGSHVMIVG